MRKFAILILFFASITGFSQWKEQFDDGDFTQNPAWSGTTDLFTVNTAKQLQLNATATGSAYLSTPHGFYKGNVWEAWVKLGLNTSSGNYCKIYLSSDQANPSLAQSAYYVMIGGSLDKITLEKKSGTNSTTLISGPDKELDKSSVTMQIKVELTHQSVWKLYVKYSTDVDYVLKGEFTDSSLLNGAFTGIECVYTSSYGKSYYFDDLSIDSIPEKDLIAPQIIDFQVKSEQTLTIQYSEAVDLANSIFMVNNDIGTAASKILSADGKKLELSFSKPFSSSKNYNLTISGVKDLVGNETPQQDLPFSYWKMLDTSQLGDVVISEIMANPVGAAALPEVEYVELHNNSGLLANLMGWKFVYDNKHYGLPDYKLYPDSSVILCNVTSVSKFPSSIPKIGIESFPALVNSGKLLYLQSPQGELSSFVEYSDKWYNDDFKAKGGFSLECIDLKNVGGTLSNWKATLDSKGGTPGKSNSVAAQNPDLEIPYLIQSSLLISDSIRLTFSNVMNKTDLAKLSNYTLSPSKFEFKNAICSSPIARSVVLKLNNPLQQGDELTIELNGCRSISGIAMLASKTIRIALTESAVAQDVVINEILFNPRLSGSDYVELYNRSTKIIDLSKLYITARKADGSLQTGVRLAENNTPFFPQEYFVFTNDKENLKSEYRCNENSNILQINSLPSMPDAEGNVQLVNSSAEIVDGLYYSEKMHHPFVKNAEGVSLERLNVDRPATDTNNWQSASSESGWGTPGYKNSQQLVENSQEKGFWLESETVTPDNNGQEDMLRLHYALSESGYTANIRVYTPGGKLISALASNLLLGTEGLITWDATTQGRKLVSPGLYLLFIEYYRFDKSPIRIKRPVVVGN
jgi:predicted DNA-binding protein YlxM (UPF0122 family)